MKFLKKILLVDHESQVTERIRGAFAASGEYLIRQETDEHLAMHVARWFLPDLILLDGNNRWMADELQAHPLAKETPVVCLTLDADRRVKTSGILRGYSFITTSICIEEAARGIAELLRGES